MLEKKNIQDILPLMSLQEGMLYHYLKEPQDDQYKIQLHLRLKGDVKFSVFKGAWDYLIKSNEVLRSVFRWLGVQQPVQIIIKKYRANIEFIDLSDFNEKDKVKEYNNVRKKIHTHRIELDKMPYKIFLICLSKQSYEMVITYHHILYDGWSNGILLKDFFLAYNKLSNGIILPELNKCEFKKFIKIVNNQNKNEQKEFWTSFLKGYEPYGALSVQKTSIVSQMNKVSDKTKKRNIRNFKYTLHEDIENGIDCDALSPRLTLSGLLFTAWGILLQKYNNCRDVVFGTTVSGRSVNLNGINEMIGLFINTIPLRVKSEKETTVSDLFFELTDNVLRRNKFENTPLVDILEYTNNNTQLFDTIMVVENYPLDNSSWSNCNDLSVESYEMLNDITNYSLTLNVEISKSLEINVVYNGDSYDDYVICNMMEHLKLIIDHMIKDPDVSVSSICTITDKEKQKIFNDFNNTDYPYAFHKDIYSMFYDQACMATNRKALLTQNNEFTYGELEKRAGQLADILLKKNIKKEDFVGVYIDRSINMIISIFGILRSGGSYLPIDPKLPKKKVSYIVDDSKTALIITEKKYASIVKEFCECLVIDDEIMLEDAAALRPESAPNSIAYSIYTSGTTGNAKGILIENHSVINRIQWMQKKFPIDHTDVILQKTPIAFDVSVWELFWWSFQGASLALLEPGKESDPKAIIDAIKKYRVTTMHFVPSMLNVFLEYVEKLGNIKDIASLKRVFASGEVLTIAHVEKFNKLLKKSNGTQLINLYGPTEATIDVSYFDCSVPYNKNIIPIGRAIDNIKLYILDKDNLLQSIGVPGELCISGVGLAREYLNNPQLTNEKFILSPFGDGKRLYQTGDRARYLLDGNIEFLGRLDYQVKLRGFRIELSEIERCMISHERIENSIVLFKEDKNGNNYLVGYYTVTKESLSDNITIEDLRSFLINLLPEYMVPVKLIQMDQFTLTINGKVDRKSLPETDEIYLEKKHVIIPPFSDIEKSLLDIWIDILDRDKISVNDHFFDVGGNSLLLIRLVSKLSIVFDIEISITNIFKYPTIKKLSNYIKELKLEKSPILQSNTDSKKRMQNVEKINGNSDIAIIGMSGKFPGSENIEEFWENLENGNECITFFDDEDLLNEGIEKTLLQNPDYVKAKGFFTDADYFDANFFGYTPKEAQIMDPQIRALHEHCWIALEDAGYNPFDYSGLIGLFVGASNNYHWISGVVDNIENTPGQFQVNLLNDRDFLSTHISYKLDLKGPSLTIQTACSTSLVAVDTAITNLIQKKCDIAMAGGVSITFPLVDGYLYQDGMINSPDGHCRAFDADANGTLLGNGAGIVVLKRLEDAQRDRDNIYAVIKSSSINNDGSDKIGYSAPSIDGQIKVIQDAQKKAGIDPESIDYIEAHGTGTILGDPIEIEALTQAFNTNQKGFCALGSVKSNIGHLDAAAGIAGLIKTVLSVNHLLIPPSLNYSKPNPKIDFENSPFYVNKTLQIWDNSKKKARAGVSSFGIGGTNAHIIVEEPPRLSSDKDSYSDNVIIISGNSYDVLYNTSKALLNYLKKNRDIKLDALAYTLQTGRKSFNFRQYFIGSDINEVINLLESVVLNNSNSRKINRSIVEDKENNLVFMFSGIGSQYLTMGKDLYRDNMFFKETLDSCFELFDKKNRYKVNYAKLLFSDNTPLEILNDFRNSQIIIFCFEYSLVKLLTNIGIKPSAVIGYSFGEYVAACISGIFSLDDAIDIIIRRGELIQTLDQGSMLSIPMPFIEIEKWLNDDLFLSINNGDSCVVSGSVSCINTLQNKLKEQRVLTQKLDTSYAIHSKLMNPILDDFIEILSKVKLNEPNIPFISSITGTWITDDQAKDPKYWCHHLVKTVEFSKGLDTLEILENKICIEIGPGNDLVQLLNRKLGKNNKTKVLNIIKPSNSNLTDVKNFMSKIGELWSYGENILWERFYNEKCQKLSLPSAPFIKQKYSIIQGKKKKSNKSKSKWFFGKTDNICDWYYSKSWERTNLISCSIDSDKTWLIFTNNTNLSKTIVNEFISRNINIITVFPGKEYRQITDTCFSVRIGEKQDYLKLITDMEYKIIPSNILHLWNLENKHSEINSESLNIDASFYSLIYLMQALGDLGINDDILLKIVSNNIHNVIGDDLFFPQKSTLLGPAKIIPLEYKNAECVSIDIDIRYLELDNNSFFLQMLLDEIFTISDDVVVSLRGRYRWIPSIKKEKLLQKHNTGEILKEKGVYLITGGFGGMGYSLAEFLAENYNSNIIMFGRTEIPDRQEWDKYINRIPHDKVTDRILKIKKIESYGTRITPICVDISNPQNLKKALSTCTLNNGKINGIFHTAGVAEYDGFIQNKSKDNIQKILDPKIMGTVLLKEFSNDLDFYFICSSIASVIYHTKMGQVAYCAAHEFIDSYVDYLSVNTNINIFSVNWSDWKNVGMSVESAKHWGEKLQLQNSQAILDEGILPSEGLTVIHEVINNSIKQVMISPEDLIDKITIYNQNKSNMLEQILLEASVNTEIYERPKLTSEYKAPTDNIEIVLCNIWETIFGIKSIGVFDDFYELGGDSLKAITVISKIHEKLNARLSLKEFYIAANILGIKDKISKMDSSNFLKLEIVEKAPNYKLSSAQKRMYLLNSFEPTELKYNMLLSWKLIGQLDINRLKYAINSVIDRHESLRTLFLFDDENPKQIIKSNVTLEIDIRIIEDDLEKEIVNFRKPFILDEAPLMRVGLFKVSNEGNILLIDIHHIISDGISNNIIISDIAKFYNNSDIEPLEFKYKDYANWEQNYIESDIFKDDEEYWIKNLQDFKKVNFPLDNQRIRKTSEKGQSFKTTVDKEIANIIINYAKAENISVFTVFFSLFNVLLAKLTGDDDIIVGVPVVGRTNSNLENIVGMFVNTLVLRNNPTGNIVLKNFLIDVNNKNTESFEKQNYPFEKLVEKIEKDREINRNPIFDIMFSMQNMVSPKLSLENLTFNPYPISSKSTQFDFSLDVIQNGNEFNLVFEYSTELFTNRSIKRYISYYNTLLNDFNFNLNKKIKNINILSEIEKELLLVKFNDTIINYPKDKTIIDMFEEQVEKTPNNIAVVFKENELTYRELNNEANKVGHFLRDNYYIESCDFVGLMLERSEKLIIGLLGILKTGAAYVPIDPQYPKKRIDYILNDSNVKIVISEIDDSIFIDINRIIFGDVKKSRLENKANNESDFYAIYTSGTTGNPKGTVISHYNYINYILWAKEFYFEDKECGNFGLFTSISFDLTTTSIFLSLLYGKTLKVFNQNTRISEILHEIFTDDLINCVKLTPSHISILPSLDIKKSNIKLAIVGGEELINDQVKILKSINKHMKIVNEYGPTETTVGCIAKQIDDIDEKILIGKPIANTKIYLMKDNNLTPVGVPGEIYISGKGVAEGYLNRTGFSEKKFLDNPFVSGERMYKSGDLGRWLPDGNIEYLGRIDNQIKIRGFRIELGEIEKSLLLYDYIDSTVVIVKEGIGVENSLIAYYVSKKELELSKIRTFLKTTLPDYMIPSFFVSIDSFPLTSNGKVDKKKLPKPDGSFSTGEQYIAPRNIIEEDLVEIWMDLLGIMQIGVNDNFFELGGSSLSILKLKKIISEKYGKVDIVDLFRNKTIKSLAKLLDRSLENKDIILDSSISLLDEYFIDERTEVEVGLVELDLEIEKSTLSKVFIISDQLKIDIEDVILSLFIYVLNEISNGDILKIQLMLDKERNKVKSNQFSLDDINSMEDLLINTNKSRKDFSKAFIYDLNHIQNIQIKNENNHILPLVYKRENYTLNYSLLEIYDLILEISNKSNRNYLLTFIANKNKLKPNKIKLLVNRFADILNQLTNEKIITEITV